MLKRSHFGSALILIAFAVIVPSALGAVGDNIAFGRLERIAGILDRTETVSDEARLVGMTRAAELVQRGNCRSDFVNAGVTVVLNDLDRSIQMDEPSKRREKLSFAETYLRHAMSCLPGNGNIWLRLGMVRTLSQGNPEEVASLLTMSQMLAPTDFRALQGRIEFWPSLSRETRILSEGVRQADLTNLCGNQFFKRKYPLDCANF